jgi:hypothetical protein
MAWIARDKTGLNPYRLFGNKPIKALMVSYDGEVMHHEYTWTLPGEGRTDKGRPAEKVTYKPLCNNEPTTIDEPCSPLYLSPGEGPVEVRLSLIGHPSPRPFEGAGLVGVLGESLDDAKDLVMGRMIRDHPPEDGWKCHDVTILPEGEVFP